jgi:hypothetical protein
MAGTAANINATTPTTVASNIIFFIYSSLFLVLANFFLFPNFKALGRLRSAR